MSPSPESQLLFLPKNDFDALLAALHARGYLTVGPTIDQEAIVYDEITSSADLPRGWTDEQKPGEYRLKKSGDDAFFGYVVGPHSWKKFLFPPLTKLAAAERIESGWKMSTPDVSDAPRYAFIGVRACELAAIGIQDQVFLNGPYADPTYAARREKAFIVAVNCTQAASTCFCTSMNTGPRCSGGFDLAITETESGFLIETGSETGRSVVDELAVTEASALQREEAATARQCAVDQIERRLNTDDIRDLLLGNLEHSQWEDVAIRCLSCTNCTMVCPTCFCSTVEEVSDLTGENVERERSWDSCFNIDFSYMNGGIARNTIRSRYRQWLTHKLATWHDQFGTSGCVGCGRCITWCPPGIDLTEEVQRIRETDGRDPDSPDGPTV